LYVVVFTLICISTVAFVDFQIPYDPNKLAIQVFKFEQDDSIEPHAHLDYELHRIPVKISTMGSMETTTFPWGDSISMAVGSTHIEFMLSFDGKNIIPPLVSEDTTLTVIEKPIIEFDVSSYMRGDNAYITITDPYAITNHNKIESIGTPYGKPITIMTTGGFKADLILQESGKGTGYFTGMVTLTEKTDEHVDASYSMVYGNAHGIIPVYQNDEIIITYEYSPGEYIQTSVPVYNQPDRFTLD
jgi:hypothetical protein